MISIIIPTYNKCSRLKYTLKHLFTCSKQHKFEIIIINDGSTDDTKKVLTKMVKLCPKNITVKIINTINKGRSSARNLGVKKASNEIILFLDDDIIINEKVLSMHIKLHQTHNNRIVHGEIYHLPILKIFFDLEKIPKYNCYLLNQYKKIVFRFCDPIDYEIFKFEKYAKKNKFEKLVENEVLNNGKYKWIGFVGANTSMKKEMFFASGGLDEKFGKKWGCEDLEFGYRLNSFYNIEFIYNTYAKSYHLDHYEPNRKVEHEINMNYFQSKYGDENINELKKHINDIS